MTSLAPEDSRLTTELVLRWSARYPADYDTTYYYPWLDAARTGDRQALERITEWKNVGSGLRPMRLSGKKRASLSHLFDGLSRYLSTGGRAALQLDFSRRAPVYSIFWSHVLYGSPIFDVYTHVAFAYFCGGERLSKTKARITAPNHWELYSSYEVWFGHELRTLRASASQIDARILDRALFKWGERYSA